MASAGDEHRRLGILTATQVNRYQTLIELVGGSLSAELLASFEMFGRRKLVRRLIENVGQDAARDA